MSDFYTEQLVKRVETGASRAKKAGLVVLTILAGFLMMITPLAFAFFVIMIVLDVFLFKRMDVEYEYLFINGDLDIDKVIHKSSRKNVFSVNISEVELIAPTGAKELQAFHDAKVYNYSSQRSGQKTYGLIALKDNQKICVIFEPNQSILEGMRMYGPRKVQI